MAILRRRYPAIDEKTADTIGAQGLVVDVTSRRSFSVFLDEPDALSRTTLDVNVWALTAVDHQVRSAYEDRVAGQSLAREVVLEEQA